MNEAICVAADTLLRVVPFNDALLVLQQEPLSFTTTITFGDVLAFLGMIGSVGVFWWQLYKTRKERRERLRSTWFLEVVVQPNMTMINDFYDRVIKDADEKVKHLSQKYHEGGAAKDLKMELARYQRDMKDEIKSSFGHLQSLLKASEPKISNEVDSVLDELVDISTKFLDGYEDFYGTSIKVDALNNKQQFVSKLYKGWNK